MKFYDITEKSEFDDFIQKQYDDDEKLKQKFMELSHKEFNFCLINMGIMLDIIRGYFYFERQKINETIVQLEKDKIKNRRGNKILKDLNQKINLRFELDEDSLIIPALAIYDGEGYLMVDKCLFIDLLLEKSDI